jgi:hypothetical protein
MVIRQKNFLIHKKKLHKMSIGIKTNRKLKVCYAYDRRSRKKHPLINLGGHYLAKYGFNIGDFVELILEKDLLTIKKK